MGLTDLDYLSNIPESLGALSQRWAKGLKHVMFANPLLRKTKTKQNKNGKAILDNSVRWHSLASELPAALSPFVPSFLYSLHRCGSLRVSYTPSPASVSDSEKFNP